jgi:hypothetical protein
VAILRGSRLRAVEAVQAWLHAAGITDGPLFRPVAKGGRVLAAALTAESVANIVKAYAKRAGFEPTEFAGHSLRAGFLTSAAEHGASIFKIWRCPATKASTYFGATSAASSSSKSTPEQGFCDAEASAAFGRQLQQRSPLRRLKVAPGRDKRTKRRGRVLIRASDSLTGSTRDILAIPQRALTSVAVTARSSQYSSLYSESRGYRRSDRHAGHQPMPD